MKKIWGLFCLILPLFLAGCDSNDETAPRYLVSADEHLILGRSTVQAFVAGSGLDISPQEIRYDVSLYKVQYRTTYKGQTITASGLVSLPQTTDPIGMLSFQHGTIVAYDDAPSTTATGNQSLLLYASLASPGLIAAAPDYIGFGASESIFHPYYVEEATASAVIDLLHAARELAQSKGVVFNEKLFLAGYSQGGYVTMATHKAIEEEGLQGFDLIASFPAAGGYDVKAMQEFLFALETYDQPHYIAYVARAYQIHYDWTAPLSEFFNEPYSSAIPELFDGTRSGPEINDNLTKNVSQLITEDLRLNIDTDPKFAYIRNAFIENSLLDWTPTLPMYMYHGDADVTVPYENSVQVYERFTASGSTSIEFVTLPGADHTSGIGPYIESFFPVMLSLR